MLKIKIKRVKRKMEVLKKENETLKSENVSLSILYFTEYTPDFFNKVEKDGKKSKI